MINKLKELRLENKYTQQEAADFFGISLRSYKTYETDKTKVNSIKYKYMVDKLAENVFVDENHGILSIEYIKKVITDIFDNNDIEYCYLFGSYAKNKANENSDVDLLISSNVTGLKYYGLIERLRNGLRKKVDLLNIDQLEGNKELLNEILRYGIKIYG